VLRDLEELVARVGREDLEQRLLVVTVRGKRRAVEHPGHVAAQDRDLGGALAVGGVGIQAEEVAVPDAHEVEVRRAVDGRAGVRLRQREKALVAFESLRRVLFLRIAEDADALSVPVPVAEEGEVVVGEPAQERGGLGVVVGVFRGRLDGVLAHGLPVLDGGAHLADHALDVLLELAEPPLVGLAHHLGVDDGLPEGALLDRLGRRQDLDEVAVVVAAHGEDRMDDQVDAVAAPVELHAHRVDEERHVVGHDLDRGVG
jgi:hypothetical protein